MLMKRFVSVRHLGEDSICVTRKDTFERVTAARRELESVRGRASRTSVVRGGRPYVKPGDNRRNRTFAAVIEAVA